MTVLIVTRTDDNECIPTVVEALRERGAKAVRFDTDRFPTETRLALRYDGANERMRLTTPESEVDLLEVTAVWHRRLAFGRRIPESMESQLRNACVQESRATAMGMIASLEAFHLDREASIRSAEHKPWQLRAANAVGFDTPRTLITNDPRAVSAFVADCPGGVVAKMLSSFAIHENGREKVVFTTPLEPSDLERMEGLELSPMTFQERVPKALELRVSIVGDRVFAAAVDSNALAGADADWRRRGGDLEKAWKPHAVPPDIQRRMTGFMDFFGLNFGAMDFILTPDGRWVFLEINPVGEFFWLDPLFSPSISEALADTLLGLAPRRESVKRGASAAV